MIPPPTLIRAGSALCLLGIVVALASEPVPGGLGVLVGLATCALGLHRLGRGGSDSAVR